MASTGDTSSGRMRLRRAILRNRKGSGMNDTRPIACTLDSEALTSRLAEIRSFTAVNLISHQLDGRVLHLRYRREAAPQLQRLVELEQACCAFLDFTVATTHSEHVELTITAPADAGDMAEWLFMQFLPESNGSSPTTSCGCSVTRLAVDPVTHQES